MDMLYELKDYCELENPTGALLLKGEWGCGKTYFVDNILSKELEYRRLFIRISLFAINSIEAIHKEIKREYVNKTIESFPLIEKAKKRLSPLKGLLELNDKAKNYKELLNGIISVDLYDWITIKNEYEEKDTKKRVVIVFDDIERSSLKPSEIMGVINDYCENRHFHVIILANEEPFEKNEKNNQYTELKEKTVQRTVPYISDYKMLLQSIIQTAGCGDSEYSAFLYKYQSELTHLFAGETMDGDSIDNVSNKIIEQRLLRKAKAGLDERQYQTEKSYMVDLITKRKHNIRSLRAALQDFKRVYVILKANNINRIEMWLYSFVSFMLCAKAGLIRIDSSYGKSYHLADYDVELLYPGYYNSNLLSDDIKDWITLGNWEKERINRYVSEVLVVQSANKPEDRVRSNEICLLDEEEVTTGFPIVVKEAYEGKLSLNEYILFIRNSKLARRFNFELPCVINWGNVQEGIKSRINYMLEEGVEREISTVSMGNTDELIEDERDAYNIIRDTRKLNLFMFSKSRNEYLRLIKVDIIDALSYASEKRLNCFDNKMAIETVQAFDKSNNAIKLEVPRRFELVFINYEKSPDFKSGGIDKTRNGFVCLKKHLLDLVVKYRDKPFSKKYTERFIEVIDSLLSSSNQSINEDIENEHV